MIKTISDIKILGIANRLIVVAGLATLGFAFFFIGNIAVGSLATKEAIMQARQHEANIQVAKLEISKVDMSLATKTPDGVQTAVTFQSEVQKASGIAGIEVDFESVGDPQIYISRFTNDMAGDNWKSIDVQMSLNGSFRGIIELMTLLKKMEPLFEFGEFEIQRGRPLADGSSSVVAKLGARVIFRG